MACALVCLSTEGVRKIVARWVLVALVEIVVLIAVVEILQSYREMMALYMGK